MAAHLLDLLLIAIVVGQFTANYKVTRENRGNFNHGGVRSGGGDVVVVVGCNGAVLELRIVGV